MTLRQEIPDQRSLRKPERFFGLRPWLSRPTGLCHKPSSDEDSFSRPRIANVLHQSKIVELPIHPRPKLASFPNIKRLDSSPPPTPEYVDASRVGNFLEVNEIDEILFRTIPELKRPAPFDM
ncbi:MAG: hypothetical protein LC776_13080 [Acidobacteria bacterium]|nr:hypothetical protein [Acidobacteriota bacterium]